MTSEVQPPSYAEIEALRERPDYHSEQQYAWSTANTKLRLEYYDCAEDTTPLHEVALSELVSIGALTGNETVLDLGSSDAEASVFLRDVLGHPGLILAVDKYRASFDVPVERIAKGEIEPLNLIVGEAQQIPLKEGSVDVVTAIRLFHHIPPEEQLGVLRYIWDLLKPGGLALITTSGEFNRFRAHELEQQIARHFGVEAPSRITEDFDTDRAVLLGEEVFDTDLHKFHHPSHSIKVTRDKLHKLLDPLISMHLDFSPIPDGEEFRKYINEDIATQVLDEIDRVGHFFDYDDRAGFIGRKPA